MRVHFPNEGRAVVCVAGVKQGEGWQSADGRRVPSSPSTPAKHARKAVELKTTQMVINRPRNLNRNKEIHT